MSYNKKITLPVLQYYDSKIKPYISNLISTLNSNLNSEISRAKETEETLKSRIDTITSLPEGSTTGDAELQDIRVKADGTTAKNAGNAVREQFNELKSDLELINVLQINDLLHNLITSSGGNIPFTKTGNRYTVTNTTVEGYSADLVSQVSVFKANHKYRFYLEITNTGSIQGHIDIKMLNMQGGFGNTIKSVYPLPNQTIKTLIDVTPTANMQGITFYSYNSVIPFKFNIYWYDITDDNPYYKKIDFTDIGLTKDFNISELEKAYYGKVLMTYGDSVTAQAQWQTHLLSELGFKSYINKGVGGRRLMSMATDNALNTLTEYFDVILIMGGINDWAQDRQIGAIDDTFTDDFTGTFYGALNKLCADMQDRFPDKRIIFMTPTPAKLSSGDDFFSHNGSSDGIRNSLNYTTEDYANAMLNVCKKWHIPCIDLNNKVGWSKYNIASYVNNEGNSYIHPNANGGIRMAECINGDLITYKPIYN